MTINLSIHQQAYIEVIYDLCKKHGHAHSKAIAESLGVQMASVTGVVRSLADKGFVDYEVRKTITLTEKGMNIASELEKRHSSLADFFHNILGCDKARSNEIACNVEHVIDEQFRCRLSEFALFLQKELPRDGYDPVAEFKKSYSPPS